jgi:class 3 adenylate cyclase
MSAIPSLNSSGIQESSLSTTNFATRALSDGAILLISSMTSSALMVYIYPHTIVQASCHNIEAPTPEGVAQRRCLSADLRRGDLLESSDSTGTIWRRNTATRRWELQPCWFRTQTAHSTSMPKREQRKLAAILFADIAGFTRQVHLDERKGLSRRRTVEQLIKSAVLTHNGRLVKSIGDGFMAEFGSAVEAVSCSLAVQKELTSLKGEDEAILVRIGIHTGDVVEEDGDIYGNAVNIAQRVQTMAPPGGICITREVFGQIRPILKLRCHPVTSASSKPMPEPLEVFEVSTADGTEPVLLAVPPRSNARQSPSLSRSATLAVCLGLILLIAAWSWMEFALAKTSQQEIRSVAGLQRQWHALHKQTRALMGREIQQAADPEKLKVLLNGDIPLDKVIIALGDMAGLPLLLDPRIYTGFQISSGTNILHFAPVATNFVTLAVQAGASALVTLEAILETNGLFLEPGPGPVSLVRYMRSVQAKPRALRIRQRNVDTAAISPEEKEAVQDLAKNGTPTAIAIMALAPLAQMNLLLDPKLATGMVYSEGTNRVFRTPVATNLISGVLTGVSARSALEAIVEVNGLVLKQSGKSGFSIVTFKEGAF